MIQFDIKNLTFFSSHYHIKYKSTIFWSVIAFFSHKSMIIPILIMFCSVLFPYMKNTKKNVFFLVFFVFMYVFSSKIIELVFQIILGSSTYAHYATGSFGSKETQIGSGLGVLLKLFCIILFCFLIDREEIDKREYKLTMTLLFCYIMFYCFAMKMYIMQRLICSIYFCFIFFILAAIESKLKLQLKVKEKQYVFYVRKYLVLFLFMVYILLFITGTKGAVIKTGPGAAGRQVNPYHSLFNYKSSDVISQRGHMWGF